MADSKTQVFQLDFTLFGKTGTEAAIVAYLREHCKRFVFQEEECPLTKRKHYQGRFSLRVKKRPSTLANDCKGTPLEGAHFSPTAGVNRDNWSYVMKADTRVKGPWKDTDAIPQEEPNEIKGKALMPWQQSVVDDCKSKVENQRGINVIVDKTGGAGKGFLRKYLIYHQIAHIIPVGQESKRIMEWVFQFPAKAYVIDIPRDTTVKGKRKSSNEAELWKSIEMVKDGLAVETRYKAQFRQSPITPHIWVFMNEAPPLHCLSKDRWNIYVIHPVKKALAQWTPGREAAVERKVKEIREEERFKRAKADSRVNLVDCDDLFDYITGERDDLIDRPDEKRGGGGGIEETKGEEEDTLPLKEDEGGLDALVAALEEEGKGFVDACVAKGLVEDDDDEARRDEESDRRNLGLGEDSSSDNESTPVEHAPFKTALELYMEEREKRKRSTIVIDD